MSSLLLNVQICCMDILWFMHLQDSCEFCELYSRGVLAMESPYTVHFQCAFKGIKLHEVRALSMCLWKELQFLGDKDQQIPLCCSDRDFGPLDVRSTTTRAAVVRRTRTQFGRRAFAVCGPDIWNALPPAIRTTDSYPALRRSLKTHLFHTAFLN